MVTISDRMNGRTDKWDNGTDYMYMFHLVCMFLLRYVVCLYFCTSIYPICACIIISREYIIYTIINNK